MSTNKYPPTSKTIRWDDPSYTATARSETSTRSSDDTAISGTLPVANLLGAVHASTTRSQTVTSTSWRELSTRDGRKYYFNSVTQKTVWEMPAEYREYMEFVRRGVTTDTTTGTGTGTETQDAAFWAILRERRVTSKWTWEEALRAIITHSDYKCIPTLQERRASFQRYCDAMRTVEEEEARLQLLATREGFKALLASDARIGAETRWQSVVDWLGGSDAFRAVATSRDRVELFEEFQAELRRAELVDVSARRRAMASQLRVLLNTLIPPSSDSGAVPQWRDVKPLLVAAVAKDPQLRDVDPVELLIAFEGHVGDLLPTLQRQRDCRRDDALVREGRARIAFSALLERLVADGTITPLSTWIALFPLLQEQTEYGTLMAESQHGSTPLDLFHDVLDRLQQAYLPDRDRIARFLSDTYGGCAARNLPASLAGWSNFSKTLASVPGLQSPISLQYAFNELFGSIDQKREQDLKLSLESTQEQGLEPKLEPLQEKGQEQVDNPTGEQNAEPIDAILLGHINDYKHLLKHLSTPIRVDSRWAEVEPRLRKHPEYQKLSAQYREAYFHKYIKWLLRKREEEPPKGDTSKRRDDSGREQERERERNLRSSRFSTHRSPSPSRRHRR